MMKIVLTACALLAFVGGLYWFLNSAPDITNYPPHAGPIVAFGDSLVSGTGSTEGNDFVSLISKNINEPVENFGVPGDTTAGALARVGVAVERHPRIAIVLLGGNDYLQRVDKEETFKNLRGIIKNFQIDGAVVVLLGVRGGLLGDNFAGDFKQVARDTGSVYVSDVLDNLLGDKKYMSDQIHPNDAGYAIIASRVLEAIRPVLK